MRKFLIAVLASAGLALSAVSAHADHGPAASFVPLDANVGETGPVPSADSTVTESTVTLKRTDSGNGTSAETPNLGLDVEVGDVLSVDYSTDDVSQTGAGAVRFFYYLDTNADTWGDAPTATDIADSATGTLSHTFGSDETVGTAGVVYDASNATTGVVTFTNLQLNGEPVSFLVHVVEGEDDENGDDTNGENGDDTNGENGDETPENGDETPAPSNGGVPTSVPAGSATLPETGPGLGTIALVGLFLALMGAVALTRFHKSEL